MNKLQKTDKSNLGTTLFIGYYIWLFKYINFLVNQLSRGFESILNTFYTNAVYPRNLSFFANTLTT